MFKVSNLVVSLIPGAKLDVNDCGKCTDDTQCNGCTNHYSDCDGGCSNKRTDHSEACPLNFVDPAEFAKLESLLEHALARVRARQHLHADLRPKSPAELETLVTRLKATLEDVERLKATPEARRPAATGVSPAGLFRVRDLLISVLKPIEAGADSGCPGCTCVAGCSGGATGCTNASTKIIFDPLEEREQVELQALLEHAAIATDAGGAARIPSSKQEITAVRHALADAIAQLERQRALWKGASR